jgi:uncharacterized protein
VLPVSPHSSEEFWHIVEQGFILQCLVGSGVHGTAVEGQDGGDEMGICVEPPDHVMGLQRFEQYIFRTQSDSARSGPGDLDVVVYSIQKLVRFAAAGKPMVLLPLFVPDAQVVTTTELGEELRANASMLLSRGAGERFIGYLRSQRDRVVGVREGSHTNRPELVDRYGFDTKYAMHVVCLGVQGVKLLETERITLPIAEPWLGWLRDLREGRRTKEEALEEVAQLDLGLEGLLPSSLLPPEPHMHAVNDWLVDAHQRAWATARV